jgi:hypothetical protein
MIERLSALIYSKKEAQNSQAEAYRKYINEVGLNCKFDVTEPPLKKREYDHIAGEMRDISNVFHMMVEMRRCQDVIMNVEWDDVENGKKVKKRHAVGLVGGEANTLVINNPWGSGKHVNPDEAAKNTEDGKAENAFTPVGMKGDDKGNISIPIGGKEATIYQFIMICPADPHAVSINGRARPIDNLRTGELVKRIEYSVVNRDVKRANGFAIELAGLAPENVLSVGSPPAWNASSWYREREPGFDRLAPEIVLDPNKRTFAGVIWRCPEGAIEKGTDLSGFSIEVEYPKLDPTMEEWYDNEQGHGIVLEEQHGNTGAWHANALTPAKRDLTRRMQNELQNRRSITSDAG